VTADDVAGFERCVAAAGVALFPADTVYGLASAPDAPAAVERLYRLKGRPPDRPAAVMFFQLEGALDALSDLGPRTRAALERLLPGALTLVLPNPAKRYPLAAGLRVDRLGVRVPALEGVLAPLTAVTAPVLQSSANRSGGHDACRLDDVDDSIRRGVDLALDAGELPGTPSTVVDLGDYEHGGGFRVLREGAVPVSAVEQAL